jgi:hypothetical protein
MDHLRPYLTVRDIPLWLAATGLAFLALTGVAQSLADPALVPVVVIVVGVALAVIVGGRVVVRRLAYRRPVRVALALLALALVFFLPGALAFVMLPSALALLAVEMMAPAPHAVRRGDGTPAADALPGAAARAAGGAELAADEDDANGFDWPEEQEPTR